MSKKTNMCILFRDEVVDTVFIDHSMLGSQIKFMERLPRNEDVFEAVAEWVKKAEKTPSRVTLCIPRSDAIQRTLSYPIAAKDELNTMIPFEATRHVPLPENDRLLGWMAADSADDKHVVLNLTAARKTAVRSLIESFERAGVPIDEAVPLSSAISAKMATVPTMLVLAEEGHIELCLYGQGLLKDSQMMSRKMPGFSQERVITAARQMVAKNKSWLGDEGIGRIFTGGTTNDIQTLANELSPIFGLHVHALEQPESLASALTDEQEPLLEALLVASLDVEPTLNLIEDKKRKVPISKRTLIISSLCLLLGIELIAAYAFKTGAPSLQRKKVAKEIKEMRRATADIQDMRNKNRIYRKQLFQLEKVSKTSTSTMQILREISEALPEDSYLSAFSCDGEDMTLKGYSKEPDRVPGLVMELPFVNTLSTSDIGKKEGDYYEFELSVSLRK